MSVIGSLLSRTANKICQDIFVIQRVGQSCRRIRAVGLIRAVEAEERLCVEAVGSGIRGTKDGTFPMLGPRKVHWSKNFVE